MVRKAVIVRWSAAIAAIAGLFLTLGVVATQATPASTSVMVFLNPHPDDEFQHWALTENQPHQYTVIVLLTQGEQSGFCDPDTLESGWQRDLEPAPTPLPEGPFTPSCAEARIASFTGFFRDMGEVDSTVPSAFAEPERSGPIDDPDGVVCRLDEDDTCTTNTTVDIYEDTEGRGALVVFDLGDGDLTSEEVSWAVRAVLDEFVPSLAPADARVSGIVGGYSTPEGGFPGCFAYPHPDHLAVDEALWSTDFGAGFQASATCATDPRRQLYARVTQESTQQAFRTELIPGSTDVLRTGAHTANYGWLHSSYYPVSTFGQGELFHQGQHYWVHYW